MAKNNLTITVILEAAPDNEKEATEIRDIVIDKLKKAYNTEDVNVFMGLGYSDFIITNKSKGTTYGRFKKHI